MQNLSRIVRNTALLLCAGVALLGTCSAYKGARRISGVETKYFRTQVLEDSMSERVEYTKFNDGSQDLLVTHGLGSRAGSFELYHDGSDEDDLVDVIRQGSPFTSNISQVFVREDDYHFNYANFPAADARMRRAIRESLSD